jgi:hypothetical protein
MVIALVVLGGLAVYIHDANRKDDTDLAGQFTNYTQISQQQALARVQDLKEVQSFASRVEARKHQVATTISSTTTTDKYGAYWTVQVLEQTGTKTSLFGTYHVYVQGGKITK